MHVTLSQMKGSSFAGANNNHTQVPTTNLQEPGSEFVVEREHDAPEPLYDDVIGVVVALVHRVLLPVLHVDRPYAAHLQEAGIRWTDGVITIYGLNLTSSNM